MKRSAVLLGFVIALAWSFSSTLQGQVLQEGTWSGTGTPMNNQGNPQPRTVSLEVKRVPDPHWQWRSGKGEQLSATFVAPPPLQVRAQASGLRLENGTLSYSFQQKDTNVSCRLNLRKDGAYEGDCVSEGAQNRPLHLTLTPPTKDSK